MNSLSSLPNSLLVEAYKKAVKLALDIDFIELLEEEIIERGLLTE